MASWPYYIRWEDFSWEALANLLTGLAAVGGAVWLGRRQIRIAERQAAIVEGQAEIESRQLALAELTLRKDLFDRRWSVFRHTHNLLQDIRTNSAPPDFGFQEDFLRAKLEAQFLFGPGVPKRLQELWEQVVKFMMVHREMADIYRREGHYGDGNPEREQKLLVSLNETFENLGDLFGDELRLGTG